MPLAAHMPLVWDTMSWLSLRIHKWSNLMLLVDTQKPTPGSSREREREREGERGREREREGERGREREREREIEPD